MSKDYIKIHGKWYILHCESKINESLDKILPDREIVKYPEIKIPIRYLPDSYLQLTDVGEINECINHIEELLDGTRVNWEHENPLWIHVSTFGKQGRTDVNFMIIKDGKEVLL